MQLLKLLKWQTRTFSNEARVLGSELQTTISRARGQQVYPYIATMIRCLIKTGRANFVSWIKMDYCVGQTRGSLAASLPGELSTISERNNSEAIICTGGDIMVDFGCGFCDLSSNLIIGIVNIRKPSQSRAFIHFLLYTATE